MLDVVRGERREEKILPDFSPLEPSERFVPRSTGIRDSKTLEKQRPKQTQNEKLEPLRIDATLYEVETACWSFVITLHYGMGSFSRPDGTSTEHQTPLQGPIFHEKERRGEPLLLRLYTLDCGKEERERRGKLLKISLLSPIDRCPVPCPRHRLAFEKIYSIPLQDILSHSLAERQDKRGHEKCGVETMFHPSTQRQERT